MTTETADVLTAMSIIIAAVAAWFSIYQYKRDERSRRGSDSFRSDSYILESVKEMFS